MPTLGAVLKAEIVRLSRRSFRPLIASFKKEITVLKQAAARQNRALARLLRGKTRLIARAAAKRAGARPRKLQARPKAVQQGRLSPRLIRIRRKKLGLSRKSFAKLLGVSSGSIFAWESGKVKPRAGARAALVAMRTIGRREALRRIGVEHTNGRRTRKTRSAGQTAAAQHTPA